LTVVKIGGGASALYTQSILFHPEAFAFVTADLIDVSKFGAWGARQVMDGISMRIARQYDIVNDKRSLQVIDVLYGYKTLRPQLAVPRHRAVITQGAGFTPRALTSSPLYWASRYIRWVQPAISTSHDPHGSRV
jgi:hypothetical protein